VNAGRRETHAGLDLLDAAKAGAFVAAARDVADGRHDEHFRSTSTRPAGTSPTPT